MQLTIRTLCCFNVFVILVASSVAQPGPIIVPVPSGAPSSPPSPFTAATSSSSGQGLVAAQWTYRKDGLGYQWNFNQSGCVVNGTNSCFSGGLYLQINGSQFTATQNLMTPDGMEYVLSRTMSNIHVTRRMKVDAARGAVRYIETLRNNSNSAVQITVALRTVLGSSARAVVTNNAVPFASKLGKKDVGLMAISSSSSRPSAMFLISEASAQMKPAISVSSRQVYVFTWTVKLPPRGTTSILHYVAQRRGINEAQVPSHFAPFYKSRLIKPDIPRDLRKTIANFGTSGANVAELPLMDAVNSLANELDVERAKLDVLFLDEDAALQGDLQCEGLTVTTKFGKTKVKLEDVALFYGAAGAGRPMRVYLRNGEILNGPFAAEKLKLSTSAGLAVDVIPDQLNMLFTRVSPNDGKAVANAVAYAQTYFGDRVALAKPSSEDPAAIIEAATAWGSIRVSPDQVVMLQQVRDPYPGYKLYLRNQSRFLVLLQGKPIKLPTLRFGSIDLAPYSIEWIYQIQSKEQAAMIAPIEDRPHCEVIGENMLAGTLDLATVGLRTSAGHTEVDMKKVHAITRRETENDGRLPEFTIELADGSRLVGQLAQSLLPFKCDTNRLRIPVEHIVAIRVPKPKPRPKPPEVKKDDPKKTDPKKGDPVKTKDETATGAAPSEGSETHEARIRELIEKARRAAEERARPRPPQPDAPQPERADPLSDG